MTAFSVGGSLTFVMQFTVVASSVVATIFIIINAEPVKAKKAVGVV